MEEFVSRGGEKLKAALVDFRIDVKGKDCADFGASTGGFTDCLLQRGARRVYSVDTAYGEFSWKLRNDPRVVVMERTNAMHVTLPEKVDLIAVDTGWTKQEKVIPNALANLKDDGIIVSLIKPHYEAGKNFGGKGLDEGEIEGVLDGVKDDIEKAGGGVVDMIESPIRGGRSGNREFLACVRRKSLI